MSKDDFEDANLKDIFEKNKTNTGNLIKASNVEIRGLSKISCEDDDVDGVRIMLKKDANDAIKEIKFICSCGQSKTIILDYNE
jgi:hypothetical protein